MYYRCLILVVFFLINVRVASGQVHAIKVITQAGKDSVVLRWAPLSPLAWQQLNKYGYRIERYTIVRDSAILENKTVKNIGPQPIKPQAQAAWEKFIDSDDYVAISAQAIFGETFEITKSTSSIVDIVNQSKELESRFSYALLAADLSPAAADLSGLRYVDKDVKRNEMYLYRVYSLVPANILAIEMGFAYTGTKETKPLPAIRELYLERGDRTLMLSWEVMQMKNTYSGYFIERSDDGGKRFQRLNKIPYVFVNDQEGLQNAFATYKDSLKSNEDTFHYRVIGMSSFGELGPPSDPIAGKGLDKFDISVDRVQGHASLTGKIDLQWEFSKEKEKLIKGFEVERSNNANDGFKKISKLLPPGERKYTDLAGESVNYYRIALVSADERRRSSFPILVQKEDSIPPLAPQEVLAKIDSTGIVTLAWKQNTESDLIGYRVYRSNFRNSEFSQVTVSPVAAEAFRDTVKLKTLTKSRFYKIAAVDNRFNTSDFSSVTEVILPDIIPPVQVTFTSALATQNGIMLKWTKCASDDAASYRIYRKSIYTKEWTLAGQKNHPDSTSFTDIPNTGITYLYKVVAVDRNGLISPESKTIRMTELRKDITATFTEISAIPDRNAKHTRLSWKYPSQNGLKCIQIYRSAGQEPIAVYKMIPAGSDYFLDANMLMDTNYSYRLKAIYNDGRESSFSSLMEVKY